MNRHIIALDQSLRANKDVCTFGGPLCGFPQIMFSPHCYSGTGFIVCDRGSFSFLIDKTTYVARAHDTVFIPDDKEFSVLQATDDLQVYILVYQIEPIRDILGTTVMSMHLYHKFSPDALFVWNTGREETLKHYIYLIAATLRGNESAFLVYERKLLLVSITYTLCSIFQENLLKSDSSNARRIEVFLELIKLIDKYYMTERGVEFYANKLFLSPKYLSGLSKSICGYTVQELVFKAIIRKSKSMLDITNMTVQEISEQFNFPNASSFGTFFKKQTGLCPQKYRDSGGDDKKRDSQ